MSEYNVKNADETNKNLLKAVMELFEINNVVIFFPDNDKILSTIPKECIASLCASLLSSYTEELVAEKYKSGMN